MNLKTSSLFLVGIMFTLTEIAMGVRVVVSNGATTAHATVLEGYPITLMCSFAPTNRPGPAKIDWIYRVDIDDASEEFIVQDGVVLAGYRDSFSLVAPASLYLASAKTKNAGFYTCKVTIEADVPNVAIGTYELTVLGEFSDKTNSRGIM